MADGLRNMPDNSIGGGDEIHPWNGPLFILGAPRSGTKLLRDLINQSNQVSIPIHESYFIPFLLNKYRDNPLTQNDILSISNFIKSTDFFLKHELEDSPLDISMLNSAVGEKISLVIQLVMLESSQSTIQPSETIWGDKTPFMEFNIRILHEFFPGARFLHIVRDPRDVATSHRKFRKYKHILRTADQWNQSIEAARIAQLSHTFPYLLIKYEDLVKNTEDVMGTICVFLGIEFSILMLRPNRITEYTGSAKGMNRVLSNNVGGHRKALNNSEIRRLESIAFHGMEAMGYDKTTDAKPKGIGGMRRFLMRMYDYFSEAALCLRTHGVVRGSKIILSKYKNRQTN